MAFCQVSVDVRYGLRSSAVMVEKALRNLPYRLAGFTPISEWMDCVCRRASRVTCAAFRARGGSFRRSWI